MARPVPASGLLWAPVSLLTSAELNEAIGSFVDANRKEVVLNVNVHCMNLAYTRPWLQEMLARAPIVFCDGAGVSLALRLLGGVQVPQRITYADWMWELAQFCEARGYTVYLLGGQPGVAAEAAAALRTRCPKLDICGTHHGYFAKHGGEDQAVVDAINRARPHILLVCFGMPAQEHWLLGHLAVLDANVFLTGGAALDYVSGRARRGPRILVDHYGEWLVRLALEPRRMWRRYVVGNPLFLWRAWRWTRRTAARSRWAKAAATRRGAPP